ncbi:TIGR01457 family HAD-type hydrolase [Lapidilactobacillus wuchangensis]|uniref:TIGR01457 family HAD-type hydrolase n=1 Tax=Lapidilactobacillus wuchangensis TaxID=2486001 RepID=UPI000F775081|nr:TIGR01457 family HAD-type hydrolase [Lapidilactobacillus wuchangensis]
MKHYNGYLIDLDGTIYRGSERIPAAKRFVERLQKKGIPFLFLTNNTTKTPAAVVKNLADNHDIHVQPEQVYTPSLATVSYLKAKNNGSVQGKTVYVIGEIGLLSALLGAGMRLAETNPDYVVVGLDYDVTYHKFEIATLAVRAGSTFIGTNADKNLPNERGLVPGAGSVISLVEHATQQQAIYIGKPEPIIVQAALSVLNTTAEQTVMVGDNYDTDIRAGINAHVDTLLVYTGVSKKEVVAKEAVQPTHEIDSLDDWEL